ncbi:prenyltransferase/squalene oxidase repeat-containing protein [Streptomyces marincola]|uniref:prenyltransferase/squalene oxidase repeat-containing protein n=1 Tax=Streptomyces marincola TaxID=2878388 RepID=UPI00131B2AB3|nr:prenyltransferase/squalene oxidase repeat-containing protein [Streptomyces marincola]
MTDQSHKPNDAQVGAAVSAAVSAAFAAQAQDGAWPGEILTGGTSYEAADIVMRTLLGATTPRHVEELAAWMLADQNEDGGWSLFRGGPSDLSSSAFTHIALQLAGFPLDHEALRRAAAFVRSAGGLEAIDMVPVKFWLAFTGMVSWDEIPRVPPELVLLPSWVPGALGDYEPMAREVVVAVGILTTIRPVRRLDVDVTELRSGVPHPPSRAESVLTGTLRAVHAATPRTLRAKALRAGEDWLMARQESDGSWGGSWTETMVCVLALWSRGYGIGHPVQRRALAACDELNVRVDGTRRVQTFRTVVMDSALMMSALDATGRTDVREPLRRAGRWLIDHRADTSVNTKGVRPLRAWDFEGIPTINADPDDTAMAITALRSAGASDGGADDEAVAATSEAARWLIACQSPSGGWAGFGVDRWSRLGEKALTGIGFVEGATACVTAHAVEALHAEGLGWHPGCRRAVRWLLDAQDADGSWPSRWGVRLYGTSHVVSALRTAGAPAGHPSIVAARRWLLAHQNPDGGWGENIALSLSDRRRATGESSAIHTAWCLRGLLRAGEVDEDAVAAAAGYLISHQNEAGTWTDPTEWMIVIPDSVYISTPRMTHAFALWALADYQRHLSAVASGAAHPDQGKAAE